MVYAYGDYEQSHTYRGDERVLQITNRANSQERLLYVHEDLRGTTRSYSKQGGQIFEELHFDAWGFPTNPNKLINNDRGSYITASFTGHSFDIVLNIYFAQSRFYDAQNRQWTSRDPVKDGLNWYRYCNNNPKTFVDPTGLVAVIYDHDAKQYVYTENYEVARQHNDMGYTVFQLTTQEQASYFMAVTCRAGIDVVAAPGSIVHITPAGHFIYSPLDSQDFRSYGVIGIGVSGIVGFAGGVNSSAQLVIDTHGNVGILVTGGVGGVWPQASASMSLMLSGVDSIYDLEGISGVHGGSVRLGPSIGAEVVFDVHGSIAIQLHAGAGVNLFAGEYHGMIVGAVLYPLN